VSAGGDVIVCSSSSKDHQDQGHDVNDIDESEVVVGCSNNYKRLWPEQLATTLARASSLVSRMARRKSADNGKCGHVIR